MKRFFLIFLILPLFFVSCDSSKNISSFDEDELTDSETKTDIDADETQVAITQRADTSVDDYGSSVAVDSKGNIFVVGSTNGGFDGNTNFGKSDVFLTKWNADGTKAWTKQWGTSEDDIGKSVAVDSDGNILVVGSTVSSLDGNTNLGGRDVFLTKWNSDGIKQWTKQWGSITYDWVNSVAVDNNDNIFVTGYTYGDLDGKTDLGGKDIFLTKWNSNGTKAWTKQWGTSEDDEGASVAIDSDGNIFIMGSTRGDLDGNIHTGLQNAFLTKWNVDGVKVWTKQWGGSYYEPPDSLTIDSKGNLLLSGFTIPDPSMRTANIFLAKWNSDGEEIWMKHWETPDVSFSTSVAVNSEGDVFVVGYDWAYDSDPRKEEYDIILAKWNSDGTKGWIKQWGSSAKDFGRGITIDSAGNLFVTGSTDGDLDGNITAGGKDVFLEKLTVDGTTVWTKQWGASFFDYGNSMAFDKDENIFVVGATRGSFDGNINLGGKDIFLTKWNSDGTIDWTKQWGTLGDDEANAIAIDSNGNIFITGLTGGELDGNTSFGERDVFLTKLTSDGTKIWTKQWGNASGDKGNSVAIDKNGNIFVAGCFSCLSVYSYSTYSSDLFLTKWSQDGNEIWTKQRSSASSSSPTMGSHYVTYRGTSVAVDVDENIFVAGAAVYGQGAPMPSPYAYKGFLANWNQDGDEIWQRQDFCGDHAKSIVTDNKGSVFVTGYKENDYRNQNIFLAKLQSDNTEVWTREWGTSEKDSGNAVVLDSSGNIFVVGSTKGSFDESINVVGQDVFLTKWSPDGAKEWTKQWGTLEYDYGESVIVDSKGNIFVTGYTKGAFDENGETEKQGLFLTEKRDLFLTKWNADGTKAWTKQWGTSRAEYGY